MQLLTINNKDICKYSIDCDFQLWEFDTILLVIRIISYLWCLWDAWYFYHECNIYFRNSNLLHLIFGMYLFLINTSSHFCVPFIDFNQTKIRFVYFRHESNGIIPLEFIFLFLLVIKMNWWHILKNYTIQWKISCK